MRLMKVLTKPATKRGIISSQNESVSHGAIITIPEMMMFFPILLKKLKETFDWHVVAERLDTNEL